MKVFDAVRDSSFLDDYVIYNKRGFFFLDLTLLVLVESNCSVLFRGTINWVNDADIAWGKNVLAYSSKSYICRLPSQHTFC